jgi:hypothetical protein
VIKGIFPIAAKPLATLAKFCSAIPISMKRFGNLFLKKQWNPFYIKDVKFL